ncbi:MAG: hypothetical protein ACRDBO_13560 [Lachnospiraceae bacterium]
MIYFDQSQTYLSNSSMTGQPYYQTSLTIPVNKDLGLIDSEETNPDEFVELEDKKVVAFYCNPHHEEFKNSPNPLRFIGDFSMTLSAEQTPETIAEADYFLVLTQNYEYGDYYINRLNNRLEIRPVHSITSIDLYDAKSKHLIRHLGQIREEAGYANIDDSSVVAQGDVYPDTVRADILVQIYENINQLEVCGGLLATPGHEYEFLTGEQTAFIGNWEIQYPSWNGITDEVLARGIMYYIDEADDAAFGIVGFRITNHSKGEKMFLDPSVRVTDENRQNSFYAQSYYGAANGLRGATFQAGQRKVGEFYFVLPNQIIQGEEPIYIEVSLEPQTILFKIEP